MRHSVVGASVVNYGQQHRPIMFVNGSGIIVSNFSINNLTVSGSLTVNASISLAPSSVLNVEGDLRSSSGNAVAVGSRSQIDVVVGKRVFSLNVTVPSGPTAPLTVTVASFGSIVGTFHILAVSQVPNYGSGTLTVTLTPTCSTSSADGLSPGAKAGIAVGAILGGALLLAVLVVLIIRRQRLRYVAKAKVAIMEANKQDMAGVA